MKRSKLITLLSIFTKEELKRFEKFIASPYFNSERNFKPFYAILKSHHPAFDSSDLTDEKIYKKLYPKKTYNKKSAVTIRVLESQLSAMAEKFLQEEEFGRNNGYKWSSFLQNLNKKGKFELATDYAKKFLKETGTEKTGLKTFLIENLIRQEVGVYVFEQNSPDWNFQKENIVRSMDTSVLIFLSKLILFYETVAVFPSKHPPDSELLNELTKCFDIKKFMASIKKSNTPDSEYLLMLYYSYKLEADKKDAESYKNLKALLFKHKYDLDYYAEYEYFIKLMNFCMFQQLGEKDHYDKEYIELYSILIKEAPEERYEDVFHLRAIRNFVRMMLQADRCGELEDYIRLYSQYFNDNIRTESINYANASMSFWKKNFNECLEIISRHTFNIPMMIKDLRIMKLQACYELCYYESLYYEIDSYRHFLADTKGMSKEFIENDKRFLKYFHRLARIREKEDSEGLYKLNEDIRNLNSSNIFIKWIGLKIVEMTNVKNKI